MAKKRNCFILRHEWIPEEIRKQLTNEQMGRLFCAILDYSAHGVERNFNDDQLLKSLWFRIKHDIDKEVI